MRSHTLARSCCPACAASVGRRRLGGLRGGRWAWVALLAALAALVPLAALGGPAQRDVALAAPSPVPTAALPPPAPEPRVLREEQVTAEVTWRDSAAHGTPNAGWLENGVLLPVRGPGYYTYNPTTQEPPGGPERRWGTTRLVRQVLDLGAWWAGAHPSAPRLGVGDLSLRGGGAFDGAHLSHQNGLDVDIRLPRADGVEGPSNPGNYDRALTQDLVDRAVAQGASLVLIGPSLALTGPAGVVMRWPNHDDHVHLRFPDPDGLGN